jgi:hypothetical protein
MFRLVLRHLHMTPSKTDLRRGWLSTSKKQTLWIIGLCAWGFSLHNNVLAVFPVGIAGVIIGFMMGQMESTAHAKDHICIARTPPDVMSPAFVRWLENARLVTGAFITASEGAKATQRYIEEHPIIAPTAET